MSIALANSDPLFAIAHVIDLLRMEQSFTAFLDRCADSVSLAVASLMYLGRDLQCYGAEGIVDSMDAYDRDTKNWTRNARVTQINSKRKDLLEAWLIEAVKYCDDHDIDIKARYGDSR